METREQEQWKVISGYPRYEVSTLGRIRSTTTKSGKKKILKNYTDKNGYQHISIMGGSERGSGERKTFFVHRLVAEAFIPNPDNKPSVDHIVPVLNGGKPTVNNLRWVTIEENAQNPLTIINNQKGREKTMRMVYQYDENLNLVNSFKSTADASFRLNKSQGNISLCCSGVWKRYLGYIFSYTPLSTREEREALENSPQAVQKRENFDKNTREAVKRWQKRNIERYREITRESARKYYERKKKAKSQDSTERTRESSSTLL